MGGSNLSSLTDLAGENRHGSVATDIGYRSLVRTGGANTRIGGGGSPSFEKLVLLEELANQLGETDAPGFSEPDNPRISAGYTYLAQLLVHDVVESLGLFPTTIPGRPWRRNGRSAPLLLDTIYGGGPVADPMLYEPERVKNIPRGYFRLGTARASGQGTDLPRLAVGEARDLPRMGCPFDGRRTGEQSSAPLGAMHDRDALVNDPRNDDNAILSQLVVLFLLFHNSLLSQIEAEAADESSQKRGRHRPKRFRLARSIVTYVFRKIVFDDLLPKLLHPTVLQDYQSRPFSADQARQRGVPIEFSHAAGRVGHAMVRQRYAFNDQGNSDVENEFSILSIVRQNSAFRPDEMPIADDWLIEWSRFFDLGKRHLTMSRKIGPSFATSMVSRIAPITHVGEADSVRGAMVLRDLVRCAAADFPPIEALIGAMPEASQLSPMVRRGKLDPEPIEAWLASLSDSGRLSDDAARSIAANPPLLIFLLFEAAETEVGGPDPSGKGERLGPIGSAIWAETMFSAHAFGEPLIEGNQSVVNAAGRLLSERGVPGTMPDLIREIAAREGWENPGHAFL